MKKLLILLLVSLSFALTPTPRKYLGIGTARQATLADSGCVLYMAIGDSIAKCLTVAKFNALVKADSLALHVADSIITAKIGADSTGLRSKIRTDSLALHVADSIITAKVKADSSTHRSKILTDSTALYKADSTNLAKERADSTTLARADSTIRAKVASDSTTLSPTSIGVLDTMAGFTSIFTDSCYFGKLGTFAWATCSAISSTSNADTLTVLHVPSDYRPARKQNVPIGGIIDSGLVDNAGMVTITPDGLMKFSITKVIEGRTQNSLLFVASEVKGFAQFTVNYSLK